MSEMQRKLMLLEKQNQELMRRKQALEEASPHRHTHKRGDGDDDDCDDESSDGGKSDVSEALSEDEGPPPPTNLRASIRAHHGPARKVMSNPATLLGSVATWRTSWQVMTYGLAAAGVIFVLIAPAFPWGRSEP